METEKQFYLVEIKFCSKTYYVVWETSDIGDYLLKKDREIHISTNGHFDGLTYSSDDVSVYDFNIISEMLQNRFMDFDAEKILDFWNLTQDAANTINYDFLGSKNKYCELYNKLFQNTSAGNIVKEYIAKTPIKNEIEMQMEAKLYKDKTEMQFAKKRP